MNNIDNILNNYFEGKALSEDEKRLKEYFRSNNVLPQHEVYRPLFAAFEKEKQITAPVFVIPLERNNKKSFQFRRLWITATSIAAVILLVITLFPFKNKTEISSGDCMVFIKGKAITNTQKAQEYADTMFMQANEIIRASYEPFRKIGAIQTEMDADRIFGDLSQKINYIESANQ